MVQVVVTGAPPRAGGNRNRKVASGKKEGGARMEIIGCGSCRIPIPRSRDVSRMETRITALGGVQTLAETYSAFGTNGPSNNGFNSE